PKKGPNAAPIPTTAPNTPKALARAGPENSCTSSGNDDENINAAPSPSTTRDRLSIRGEIANPEARELSPNTTIPIKIARRRPNRSASEPQAKTSDANVSV